MFDSEFRHRFVSSPLASNKGAPHIEYKLYVGEPWAIPQTSHWLSDAIPPTSHWLSDAIPQTSHWLSDDVHVKRLLLSHLPMGHRCYQTLFNLQA